MLRKLFALAVVGTFSMVLAGCSGDSGKTKTPAKTPEKTKAGDGKTPEVVPAPTAPAGEKTPETKT